MALIIYQNGSALYITMVEPKERLSPSVGYLSVKLSEESRLLVKTGDPVNRVSGLVISVFGNQKLGRLGHKECADT